jgi:hypothetical protein
MDDGCEIANPLFPLIHKGKSRTRERREADIGSARKGIARTLLTACLSEATDRVALLISADSEPERRLYNVFWFQL